MLARDIFCDSPCRKGDVINNDVFNRKNPFDPKNFFQDTLPNSSILFETPPRRRQSVLIMGGSSSDEEQDVGMKQECYPDQKRGEGLVIENQGNNAQVFPPSSSNRNQNFMISNTNGSGSIPSEIVFLQPEEKERKRKASAGNADLWDDDIPHKRPRGRPKGSTNKGRPKRPLSAYNFFFKEERTKILAALPDPGKEVKRPDEPEDFPPDVASENAGQAMYTKDIKKERKKAPHRKIGFESLAKVIAERWSKLSPEEVKPYQLRAKSETDRYKKDLEIFYSKQKEASERANINTATGGHYSRPGEVSTGYMNLTPERWGPQTRAGHYPPAANPVSIYPPTTPAYASHQSVMNGGYGYAPQTSYQYPQYPPYGSYGQPDPGAGTYPLGHQTTATNYPTFATEQQPPQDSQGTAATSYETMHQQLPIPPPPHTDTTNATNDGLGGGAGQNNLGSSSSNSNNQSFGHYYANQPSYAYNHHYNQPSTVYQAPPVHHQANPYYPPHVAPEQFPLQHQQQDAVTMAQYPNHGRSNYMLNQDFLQAPNDGGNNENHINGQAATVEHQRRTGVNDITRENESLHDYEHNHNESTTVTTAREV